MLRLPERKKNAMNSPDTNHEFVSRERVLNDKAQVLYLGDDWNWHIIDDDRVYKSNINLQGFGEKCTVPKNQHFGCPQIDAYAICIRPVEYCVNVTPESAHTIMQLIKIANKCIFSDQQWRGYAYNKRGHGEDH